MVEPCNAMNLSARLLLGVLAGAVVTAAAADFPDHAITMVVPFPPGGVADAVARPVAEAMGRDLQQPVIIENKAGAGGGIGMGQVAKARADGYTVLMSLSSYTVLPEADKILGRAPLYLLEQLKPIARFTADPTVFVVRADAPWKTWAEFAAAARANPGKYTYGSSGNYGTMHVPMEMLLTAAGLKMTHVPYTGAGSAIVGLLGGSIDAVATGPATIVQQVNAGKLRALAQWGNVRLAALPDVPTFRDLGTNVDYAQWSGLFVPAATPEPVVKRLRDAASAAANDERVKQVMTTAGSPIQYLDTPEFQRYVDADAAKMADVVKRIGKVE